MNKTRLILVLSFLSACVALDSRPTLIIASDATFAPFHYIDEHGAATGFDIELARAIATNAGFDSKIEVRPYADLFDGLQRGSHDVVAATTGITPDRLKNLLFSDPYFTTCQVAVVRSDATSIQSVDDLAELRVGAAGSGTSANAMRSIDGVQVAIEDGAGVEELDRGSIDAWIVDEFDGINEVRLANGRLRLLPIGVASEQYGFVFAKERLALRAKMNRSLAALVNDGTVDKLRAEFGVSRANDWPVRCDEYSTY